MKHICLGLFLALALFAAPPVVINRDGAPILPEGNGRFGGPYEVYWQAVPTTITAVTTTDAHITAYCFYNSNGASVTLTIQTGDASPLPLPLSGPIATGTSACFTFPIGQLSKGGFKLAASTTGVYYGAVFTN